MAASKLTQAPSSILLHEQYTSKKGSHHIWHLSLGYFGRIVTSGTWERGTFIDVFSRRNDDTKGQFELLYSKFFSDNREIMRFVSFFGKNGWKIVTCNEYKIEIIDIKSKGQVLRSCEVEGTISCLTVRKNEIFIGFSNSLTVVVFNEDLKETDKIILKGLQDIEFLIELQVINQTVFARTFIKGRVFSMTREDGSIITEYTTTIENEFKRAYSMAVSEELETLAVLWNRSNITLYPLTDNKPLLVFHIDSGEYRVRISAREKMIITGNDATGEIKFYDLEQSFNFEAMKRTLAIIVSPGDYKALAKYFEVTEDELSRKGMADVERSKKISETEKRVQKMDCLLTIIEERGHLNPYNVMNLIDAISTISSKTRVASLKGPIEGYLRHGDFEVNVKNLITETMTRNKSNAKESETAKKLDNMKKSVTCSICLDIWTEPKTLPCDHIFCKKCVEVLMAQSRSVGLLSCPECRKKHRFSAQELRNSWCTHRCLENLAKDFKTLNM